MRFWKFICEFFGGVFGATEKYEKMIRMLEILLLILLISGYAVPREKLPEWAQEAIPLWLKPYLGVGAAVMVSWWGGLCWERSRLPRIKIGEPNLDNRQKRVDIKIGSTEDHELEAAIFVTEVFAGRQLDTSIRRECELNWRELPPGQRARISRLRPQYASFLKITDCAYLDGKGGGLPLRDSKGILLLDSKEIFLLEVVVTFFKNGENVSRRRRFKLTPDPKITMGFKIESVWFSG